VLVVAAAAAAALRPLRPRFDPATKRLPVSRRERIGWLILGLVLTAALVRSLVVPESGWDAYAHWGLRAQAFASAGTIVDAHSEHEYYPPLVPLLEAWLYLNRGLVSIDMAKVIWAVAGGAFGVCVAWHLRFGLRAAWLGPYVATAIVLASTALLESFWTGQADLPLTVYLTLAVLAIWQWQRARGGRGWLVQAAIFGAAATLTKFEGLPRLGIVLVALVTEMALLRHRALWRPALVLALAGGIAALLWTVFELTHGIAPNGEHLGAFQPLAIGSVLLALVTVFGGFRTGGGLLVAALAWVVSAPRLAAPPLRLLALVVLGELVATLVAFLLSSTAPDVEVRTSATRLVEQCMPLALFVGAIGLSTLHL
jgi:hypothetical protein